MKYMRARGKCDMCGKEGCVAKIGPFWVCNSNICYKILAKLKTR